MRGERGGGKGVDASEGGDDGEGREEGRSDQPLKPWLFVLVDDYQPPAQYSQSRSCFVDGHGFVRFADMSDELKVFKTQ